MKNLKEPMAPRRVLFLFSVLLVVSMLTMPLQLMYTRAQSNDRPVLQDGKGQSADDDLGPLGISKERIAELEGLDIIDTPLQAQNVGPRISGASPLRPEVGTDQGVESEPNDTIATADALAGTEGRIKGYNVPANDVDYYSLGPLAVGDRVYASLMTGFSPGSVDSLLDLRDSADVVVETDLNDGTFSSTSSVIAGRAITVAGTYYLRVRENAASTIRPYELYFAVKPAATPPTPEVESNNTIGTANPIPASGWVSGTRDPASDADFFSMTLAAGDTVAITADLDPERDNIQWNGRIGMALFGTANNQILVGDDPSVGSVANPLGEAFFMTVKDAGTYYAYVDSATAGTASPTFTYHLNVMVIPAASSAGCTTYTNSTPTPIADLALSSSTITVPPTTNRIRDVNVFIDATHTFFQDTDWHLRSPAANDNGIISDVGAATAGGPQTTANLWLDDEAGIVPSFSMQATFRLKPEAIYRLDWFDGENPSGTWTLDVRDDATGDVGLLNSWSLEICEEPAPVGTLIYDEDFEGGMGGYTHSGTADEWEYGTPATPATSVSPAQASFLNCSSGVNCWKTDLDATYDVSSNQNLVSPTLNLTQFLGTINLYWSMRYQMESATFDHAWVDVTQVGNPANTRRVWQWYGATMSEGVGNPTVQIGESAGWGRYSANISDFAGMLITVTFHVDSDSTVNYPGMAIDDVQLRQIGPTAANVSVGGRVLTADGRGLSNAVVTLSGQNGQVRTARSNGFGYYSFDSVELGQTYMVTVSRKGFIFEPGVVTPQDNVSNLDFVGQQQE